MKIKKQRLVAIVAAALTLGCAASFAACKSGSDETVSTDTPEYETLSLSSVYKEKSASITTYTATKVDAGEGFSVYNYYSDYGLMIFCNSKLSSGEEFAEGEVYYKYYSTSAKKVIYSADRDCYANVYSNSGDWFGVYLLRCEYYVDDSSWKVGNAYVVTEYDSEKGEYTFTLLDANGTKLDSYTSTSRSDCNYYSRYFCDSAWVYTSMTFNGNTYYVDENGTLAASSSEEEDENPFVCYTSTSDFDKTVGDYCYDKRGTVLTIYSVKDDELGSKVVDYTLPDSYSVSWYPLANGNVLIQTIDYVEDDSEDYDANIVSYGVNKIKLSHYIYNVTDKTESEITLNCYVSSVYANEKDGTYEDTYSSDVQNIAYIAKIVDGMLNTSNAATCAIVSLNSDGTVVGELATSELVTNSSSSYYGAEAIVPTYQGKYTDGYYLYDSEMKELGYIKGISSNSVYFVTSTAIYDYNLSKVYDIKKNEMTVLGLTQTGVVLCKTVEKEVASSDTTTTTTYSTVSSSDTVETAEYYEYYLFKDGKATKIADTYEGDTFISLNSTSTGTGAAYRYCGVIKEKDGVSTLMVCDYEGNTLISVTGTTSSVDSISRVNGMIKLIYTKTSEDGSTTVVTEYYTITTNSTNS